MTVFDAANPRDRESVAVVIVSYNTCDATLDSVSAALEQLGPDDVVVVVDNASKDATIAELRVFGPRVLVIALSQNVGFAAAVNRGAAAVSTGFVLLLNSDTVLLPNAIEKVTTFATDNPAHGLYGGRTRNRNGSINPSSCWGEPTVWAAISFGIGTSTFLARSEFFNPESLGRWDRGSIREVPVITGCFLLVSRVAWRSLGGMDETYFLYGEDTDFSKRAWLRGYRPVIVPQAELVHEGGASSSSSGRKMAMILAGRVTYARLHNHTGARLIVKAFVVFGVSLRALGEVVCKRHRGSWSMALSLLPIWIRGYPSAVRLFPDAAPPDSRVN